VRELKKSDRHTGADLFLHYASPIAFIAVSGIPALVTLRTFWILGIAYEARAVPPAPTLRVVFAPFGLGFADITMFGSCFVHTLLVRLLWLDRQEWVRRIGSSPFELRWERSGYSELLSNLRPGA
jgi:hypothetical protein